jgi:hypothetical protein
MIDVADSHQRSVALKWPNKRTAGITSVLVTGDSLLVGFNIGEWGGGLRQIDRKTGNISMIERKALGSIVEVCGSTVKRLYGRTYGGDHYSTVPFFGVVAAGSELWAIGIDGTYRIGTHGVAAVSALPAFRQIGNASVSFALPHFVLVLTDVNKRRSVSGGVPMIVPR